MGAYVGLLRYFHKGVLHKAEEMGYSEPNLLILAGDEQSLRSKYPNVWDALLSCKHHRDHRSPIAYGRDLVASWVFEDCIISSLCEGGIDAQHGGSDCDRQVLYKDGVTANSDVKIIVGDNTIPIEIMCDYTGWWTANGRIDLRDNKYSKLKESKSLFLGFSTTDNILIVMDFSKDITYEYFEYYTPYGGKPAYSIEIPRDSIYQFEIPLMVDIVKSICLSRST